MQNEFKLNDARTTVQSIAATSTGATGSIQSFTVNTTGWYFIETLGARGGHFLDESRKGGLGAKKSCALHLIEGQRLSIVVGQAGVDTTSHEGGAGGGGGTFVYVTNSLELLVAAGGGGGAGDYNSNSWGVGESFLFRFHQSQSVRKASQLLHSHHLRPIQVCLVKQERRVHRQEVNRVRMLAQADQTDTQAVWAVAPARIDEVASVPAG
jgi:hypothetical protein